MYLLEADHLVFGYFVVVVSSSVHTHYSSLAFPVN
jgi:hypothetical protein